jgi:peptide/nickel transport system substrate-binding protein
MVVALATMLALTGCTPPSEVVAGTTVTVAVDQPFTSYNPKTGFGSGSTANASVFAATNASFASYDETPALVEDESFGSYELVGTDPLTVKYTVREGIRWSDGTPIDAADLLLAWAANSTTLNDPDFDPKPYIDQSTGRFTDDFPRDAVYFDGFTGNGLQLVTSTPVVGDDGRSITMTFDEYFADWQLVFDLGLPAHIVAGKALKLADAQQAKDAAVSAITEHDRKRLAAISRVWNSGFNIGEDGPDAAALVSSGPYLISELTPGEGITLTVNPEYRGENLPHFETIVVRVISDPLQAVAALEAGEVDIISPGPTEDVIAAIDALDDSTVEHGFSGTWERLDLQFGQSKNGFVESELVRRAFLATVPRQGILDALIKPVSPSAQVRDSHVFLPGSRGYDESVAANGSSRYAKVDIAAAKRLLARAAQQSETSAAPTVCVLFDPANPRRVSEFQLIQHSAGLAGITVTDCSSPDWRNLLGTPHSYDAALYALRDTNLAMAAVGASYWSGSELNNHSHYANPAVDALLADAMGAVTAKERRKLLEQIDTTLWKDAAGMPLYQFPTVTVTSDRVTGVVDSPFEPTALWRPWKWEPVTAE